VGVVFEDELFEVEECSFVRDFLPDLDDCLPGVGCVGLRAVRTLLVGNDKFTLEGLLEDSGCECFFLDGEFDSDSTGVRFCPDKAGINQTDLYRSRFVFRLFGWVGKGYLVETSEFL
jgi:hypothetical protein